MKRILIIAVIALLTSMTLSASDRAPRRHKTPRQPKPAALKMPQALKAGDKVQMMGFGTFEIKERAARTGRKPSTGETIEIPAKKSPSFKAGKGFKDQF